ncbi:GEM-like protein 1 isoform X2 [Phoenix dactylifera]|uniref:GEM-like protein 1 isoform X2 n=1 Tax=Phoenix dactylifera TaxID=42345 RepID=A0A8B7CXL7_PHODC|nr:GEM-like protein 1 isoform X2 [Phoenix dactylifera]
MEGKQEGRWGAWAMGTPAAPQAHQANQQAATWVSVDYIPSSSSSFPQATASARYMNNSVPPSASSDHVGGGGGNGGNPYVHVSPAPGSTGPTEMILRMLNRCGKKLEDHGRKAGDAAGNVWHHLKTGPSVTNAAMARLAQGTKVLAEGGRDKVFQQTFGILPGEQLKNAYACYLSTSSGPVIGTLYISTRRLAFCSDKPLCHNVSEVQQEWIYYQVVVGLEQLRSVNSSANVGNPAEKYIQIITMDNHEFWFMGFVSYDKALKNLREALQHSD